MASLARRGRWRGWLLLLLLLLAWVLGCSFVQPRPVLPVAARSPREGLWRRAEGKGPRGSMIFLAVKDAIYTALFGAPVEVPDVPSAFGNLTSEAATTAAKGVRAVEGAASSVYGWGLSKLQELGSLLHLSGNATQEEAASEVSVPEIIRKQVPVLAPLLDQSRFGEPGDFFLFIKDYGWTLRYRVSNKENSVDTERPLLLDWIKLRRPVQKPSELLELPNSELFDWDIVEPPRHSGFMYQVTEVVAGGVEAVINFFRDRGPKLLVQQEGVSLVNEEADAPGKPVTHCWVQVFGLPFLPVLQYIAFLNHDEIVTDWRA